MIRISQNKMTRRQCRLFVSRWIDRKINEKIEEIIVKKSFRCIDSQHVSSVHCVRKALRTRKIPKGVFSCALRARNVFICVLYVTDTARILVPHLALKAVFVLVDFSKNCVDYIFFSYIYIFFYLNILLFTCLTFRKFNYKLKRK